MNQRQYKDVVPMEVDMDMGEARRGSAALGHLRPAVARSNVRVLTGGLVERVLTDGHRAAGLA